MGPEGALGVRDDLFSEYALDHCFDEMFDAIGQPRAPYAALHSRLLELSPAESAPAAARRRQRVPATGHHVHGLRRRAGHRAHLSLRSAAAHHDRARVGHDRARAVAAADRAQSVPQGHLSRRPHPRRKASSRASWSTARSTTGREMRRHPPAARHLRVGRRHRSRAAARRPVRRARRQPARAERRVVHADEPPDHQARLPAAVHGLRDPSRSITTGRRCWRRCARSRRPTSRTRRSCC